MTDLPTLEERFTQAVKDRIDLHARGIISTEINDVEGTLTIFWKGVIIDTNIQMEYQKIISLEYLTSNSNDIFLEFLNELEELFVKAFSKNAERRDLNGED